MRRSAWDVIVVGGGPAGATTAALTAASGLDTLLLERATEPGLKVGESLMPATYWTLDRLGVLPRMRASAFPKKYSVQFFSPSGRASTPFYFHEADPHESSQTWQVRRRDFDALLLENARDKGAEVRLGATVRELRFQDQRCLGVVAELDGGRVSLDAGVVVDASGQRSLIARRLGLRQLDPQLRHVAYWSHFAQARRDGGIDEGATLIFHTGSGRSWFWFIPLPDDLASVGVVGHLDHLVSGRKSDPQAVFDEELVDCSRLAERLQGVRQALPMQAAKDFSYTSSRIAGDGWVLVGDAFGFLDPIYSTGVFLALTSGEMAADAIIEGSRAGDLSGRRLGRFGPRYAAGMEAMRKLVYAFYDPDFSFARFLERFPEHRKGVVDLLTGNVFRVPVDRLLEDLGSMCVLPQEVPRLRAAGSPM